MNADEMYELLGRLSYSEVARLHAMTASELDRRNTKARLDAGDTDGGW